MIIRLDKLPREGLRISHDFEYLSADLIEENTVFLSPVHGEALIQKVGDEVMVKGRLAARLSFVCSRCLSPFEYAIDSSFDLVYLPEELDLIKEELEDDDLEKVFYRGDEIDLREVVLEQLNLAFPSKPLCSERCEGICAVCGKIRRGGQCHCLVKEEDPRLGKLKNLLRDKS